MNVKMTPQVSNTESMMWGAILTTRDRNFSEPMTDQYARVQKK
jgi:hypothetical protein